MEKYTTLFDPNSVACLPIFRILLCMEENTMVLFPSEADVETALLAVVEMVAGSLQSVGRIQVCVSFRSTWSFLKADGQNEQTWLHL